MSEHPVLFSAPMVRALLAGTKTQTRRVVKPQPSASSTEAFIGLDGIWRFSHPTARCPVSHAAHDVRCPYGAPGDRLWVREAWARATVFHGTETVVYREGDNRTDYGGPWKPGIHLFRRDSRITLEITDVRVERLQEISEADAIAEGIEIFNGTAYIPCDPRDRGKNAYAFARGAYGAVWEQINGPGSWAANPWVWVIEFRRI